MKLLIYASVLCVLCLLPRQPRIGQIFVHAFNEGGRHVDAHRGDLLARAVALARICREAFKRLRLTPGCDEPNPARLHVGDQRQTLVAAPARVSLPFILF
jgi:hypothetical protein